MRTLKIASIICGLFCLVCAGVYVLEQPAYTIKTEGTLYVVNKGSSTLTVFDLFAGKQLAEIATELEPHEATVVQNPTRVVITNYGSVAAAGNSISVVNTSTHAVEKTIGLGNSLRPHGIIAMPNADEVGVVTDIGNHLSIVNVKTGELKKQVATQQDFSHLLVHHPTKPLAYVSNIKSGSVSVINTQKDSIVAIIPCSARAEGIDINLSGTEVWVSNIDDDTVSVINTQTNEITHTMKTGREPLRVKFSTDGKQCFVSNATEGTISVYDTTSKKQIQSIRIPGNENIVEKILYRTPRPVGMLMHPNGAYAFVSNITVGRVAVVDLKSYKVVSSIHVGAMPDGLAFIK